MTTRFSQQSHRIGYIRVPDDHWGVAPLKVLKVRPEDIASGRAATLPMETLEKLNQPKVILEEERRKKAIALIEEINASEIHLNLHYTSATLKLRSALVGIEDLGGYLLFGHRTFKLFWEHFFPGCGSPQRALLQSHCATALRLLNLPVDGETPTTNALRRIIWLGIRDSVHERNERGQVVGNFSVCRLDRAELAREAWRMATELAKGEMPTEKEVLQAVRELAKLHPEIKSPKARNPLEDQIQKLELQLDEASIQIRVLQQENQQLRGLVASQEVKK